MVLYLLHRANAILSVQDHHFRLSQGTGWGLDTDQCGPHLHLLMDEWPALVAHSRTRAALTKLNTSDTT
jgi:hypothetical protein